MSGDWGTDLDPEDLLRQAAHLAARILHDTGTGPVTQPIPPDRLRAWREAPAPTTGRSVQDILAAVRDDIAPYPMGNGHPRFMAWVNSPPHPVGVAATVLAAALNPSVAGGRHAAVHVEHAVTRWFLDLLGWGTAGYGLFVSGGSAATTTALAAARHRAYVAAGHDDRELGLSGAPRPALFATGEAHSCATKSAQLLGIGSANIVPVATDGAFRMDPEDLRRQIGAAIETGRVPVAAVASVGTVNTGAIDPIAQIAAVCAEFGVWLHVDGSYGGPPALLLDRYAAVREALARADSLALDPHKWLYVPVDAGLVLFRDADTARSTFSLVPSYLSVSHTDDEPPWIAEYGSEQTRSFRALKLWMTMQYLGLDGYRDLISRDLEVADLLRTAIADAPDLELLAGELSVVCFRHLPGRPDPAAAPADRTDPASPADRIDPTELDAHNRSLCERLQRQGHAFLAPTVVKDVAALRACIVDPRTDRSDLDAVLAAVRTAARPA